MELTDEQVAKWLEIAHDPSLTIGDDPAMRALLRAHGRAADHRDPKVVSLWARGFLKDKVEALNPDPRAPEREWLPYRVLKFSFLERQSIDAVARRVGLWKPQTLRELAKAIHLLRVELESPFRSS